MTTIAKADEKRRLPVPGVRRGGRYRIKQQIGGWWIELASGSKRRARMGGAKKSLVEHLTAMAEHGLTIEPIKSPIPPCRF